jgi:chromate reductase, NAD(P)H dehydrogenase (quinone)
MGSIRSQLHLRHICIYLNLFAVNRPEVMITQADKKFDADGNLTDETARKFLRELLEALADLTGRLRKR